MTSEGWRMEAEALTAEQIRWWMIRGVRCDEVALALRCKSGWLNICTHLERWWIERRQESA